MLGRNVCAAVRRRAGEQGNRHSRGAELLEKRLLLAAHIAGNSTVFPTIQAAVDAAAPGVQ